MITKPQIIEFSSELAFPADTTQWLRELGQATWFDIPGRDESRCRVITTLLHGNEPSGAHALLQWLKEQPTPRVNLHCLVASVPTALEEPIFSNRMLPGRRDLNRCFRAPFDDEEGQLAKNILDRIATLNPECLVDVHNTSGTGPSFAVAGNQSPEVLGLSGLFCRRLIVTDLLLGSLMELSLKGPAITVECGGAKDQESLSVARRVYEQMAAIDTLADTLGSPPLEVLVHPIRVRVKAHIRLRYAMEPQEDADVTLFSTIEHQNHGISHPNTRLGWVGPGGLNKIEATTSAGKDLTSSILREEDGWLYPTKDLKLFMATTNAHIAVTDCLFYATEANKVNE